MDPRKIYKFCPICGKGMIEKPDHPQCSSCGFVFYINPAPGCGLIIENDDQEILLVKRKHDPKKGSWDLPGGFMMSGEDIYTSSKRELMEELGVDIEVKKVIGFYPDVYVFQNVGYPILTIATVGKIVKGNPTPADDVSGYAFFQKDKILQQEIGFPSIRKALEDYLVLCKK
jgi:ADP-ribose pyrophosphatase YjhB (NUDIX family)